MCIGKHVATGSVMHLTSSVRPTSLLVPKVVPASLLLRLDCRVVATARAVCVHVIALLYMHTATLVSKSTPTLCVAAKIELGLRAVHIAP